MAKIKVLRELEQKCEEFSVTEDDLILVMKKIEDKLTHPVFGVFSGFSADKKSFRIAQPYILRSCEFLGGYVPLVEPIQSDPNYGRVRPPSNQSPNDRYFYSKITKSIIGIYSGKDKIVNELKKLKGFEPHADWIEKLKKPYLAGEVDQ